MFTYAGARSSFFQKLVLFSKARSFFKIPCFFCSKSRAYLASLVVLCTMSSQASKGEKRKAREYEKRKDSFTTEYVRIKYPHIYAESVKYYDKLRVFYPEKHDLRKTEQFKRWKRDTGPHQAENSIKLNMELRIPLWDTTTLESVRDIHTVTEEVLGEGIYPSLLEEVSPECVEQIIDELRQDPDLKDIFTAVESEFDQGLDVGAEIEIDEDTRLENELLST